VVNAVAETFVNQNSEKKLESNQGTGKFLTSRVAELQGHIREDEEKLVGYAKRNEIISLKADEKHCGRTPGRTQQASA